METNPSPSPMMHGKSNALRHLLYMNAGSGKDLRGFLVIDRYHKKIGTICEVFCDRVSSKPRYIEIIPLNEKIQYSLMVPFESVKWVGKDGPATITSSASALFDHEEYDFEHVMQTDGAELVTFNETFEADSRYYISANYLEDCA